MSEGVSEWHNNRQINHRSQGSHAAKLQLSLLSLPTVEAVVLALRQVTEALFNVADDIDGTDEDEDEDEDENRNSRLNDEDGGHSEARPTRRKEERRRKGRRELADAMARYSVAMNEATRGAVYTVVE